MKNKNFILGFCCILIFILIVFPKMINHTPNQQEVQHYMSAYFMNTSNFMEILNHNGSTILWYLIMMPFAKTDTAYPYPMYFISFGFMLASLLLMWIKAPFNNFIKIAVTFSVMFVSYFGIFARWYTMGIFALFLTAALSKDQLKRPVIYSIAASFAMHSNTFAAIGASGLIIPFVCNLIKNKDKTGIKSVIISLSILAASICLLIIPHHTFYFNSYPDADTFWQNCVLGFIQNFEPKIFVLSYFLVLFFLLFIPPDKNNKTLDIQSKFFLLYTFAAMWIFSRYFFNLAFMHQYYFFIFIIAAMWMQDKFKDFKPKYLIFYAVFAVMLYSIQIPYFCEGIKEVYDYGRKIQQNEEMFENSTVIFTGYPDMHLYSLAPMLIHKKGISIYSGNHPYDFISYYRCPRIEDIRGFIEDKKSPVFLFADRERKEPFITDAEEEVIPEKYMYNRPYKPDYENKYFYEHPDNSPLFIYKLK